MIFNRETILEFFDKKGIKYESVDHPAVLTMETLLENPLPHTETLAKNLFVRNDKKTGYYLISCHEEKQIKMKDFQHEFGLRHLSFASEDDLAAKMHLKRGAVTPLGALNNEECDVEVFIDKDYKGKMIGVPACDNDRTVYLDADDVVKLLQEHGNKVQYF